MREESRMPTTLPDSPRGPGRMLYFYAKRVLGQYFLGPRSFSDQRQSILSGSGSAW